MSQLHKTRAMQASEGVSNSRSGVCVGVSTHSDTVQRVTTESVLPLPPLNHVRVSSCKIDGGCGKISARIQKQKKKGQEVILRATKRVLENLTSYRLRATNQANHIQLQVPYTTLTWGGRCSIIRNKEERLNNQWLTWWIKGAAAWSWRRCSKSCLKIGLQQVILSWSHWSCRRGHERTPKSWFKKKRCQKNVSWR